MKGFPDNFLNDLDKELISCCFPLQHMDGSYCVKPLKQKQVVNTPAFILCLPSSFCVTFYYVSERQRNTKALFPS